MTLPSLAQLGAALVTVAGAFALMVIVAILCLLADRLIRRCLHSDEGWGRLLDHPTDARVYRFPDRQEREAQTVLFPTRGRKVVATPKVAPAQMRTVGRVTQQRGDADEHDAF